MTHDVAHVQEFFGARAAGWDARFPGDDPAFAVGVAALGLRTGDVVLDAGCGTGRALPVLRAAVGSSGKVIRADITREMLEAGARTGRGRAGTLLLADVARLPLRPESLDAVFAAGLFGHLRQPAENLREMARVVRPGGRLALFHVIGRAALAARQGRPLTKNDLLEETNVRPLLRSSGWQLASYADEDAYFLALAVRQS
ncbi:class I SAM-dependent methyltransferase [Streptomyces sp. NPDC051776]|uniref:class I SAM-dependent methyltransferase n=1 Tax=Streptomyces sp. NPDC051776 TaxID=3155414 RepID=UPI003413A9AB